MEVKGVKWFCGRTNVGVVMTEDYGERKYYIAAVSGQNEQDDIQFIADWGSSFDTKAGDALFGYNR